MGEQTITTSLREQAIAAAEQAEREVAEYNAAQQADLMESIIRWAARHAVQVFGEVAKGVEWQALDTETAIAWIGEEPFRYVASDGHWLYHVTTCLVCGKGRVALVHSLEGLGKLLRSADPAAYDCETCDATEAARRREEHEARRSAEACLLPLPTSKDREQALRDAATYHQLAKDRFAQGDERGASAAATVPQSASALARTIQQDVQTWGGAA